MPVLASKGCLRIWLRACVLVLATIIAISSLSHFGKIFLMEEGGVRRDSQTHKVLQTASLQKNSLEDIQQEMQSRRNQMLSRCNESNVNPLRWTLSSSIVLDSMYLDLKNGLVYCAVLKGGSTFWKRMLGITSGIKSVKNPYDIPAIMSHDSYLETLKEQPSSRKDKILSSSLKFMFSRDPYARLFSCYIDKVFTPRPFYQPLRVSILKTTRPGWDGTARGKACALDVSFDEFFRFVISSVERHALTADEHFLPMYQTCRPCDIKYDVLGKMETFWQDARFVLDQKGLDKLNFTGLTSRQSNLDAISDIVDSVFAERSQSEKCLSFNKVLEIVWKKAIIRGILSKQETIPKSLTNSFVTAAEFLKAFTEAYRRSEDDTERHKNQKSAMIEAFSTISSQDLRKYQLLFRPDFEIFGYDMNRPDIFDTKPSSDKFSFLT